MIFLKALQGKNDVGRPPVWVMRQAGRYLPTYRKMREKYSFMELCSIPELVCEVTKLPINILEVDAAILFSDIVIPLQALGVKVDIVDGIGPVITQIPPLKDMHLRPVEEVLSHVKKAVMLCREQIKVPLIGFAAAPYTLMCYLLGGVQNAKIWIEHKPQETLTLLSLLEKLTIQYLNMQIEAGVHAIQIFDSHAPSLSLHLYNIFSLPFQKTLVEKLSVPKILFSRGSFFVELISLKPEVVGVDWEVDIIKMRREYPHIGIQGNFDPKLLLENPGIIKKSVSKMMRFFGKDPAYIANLGHGILPSTSMEAAKAFVDAVKST